jgi:hypothetical protein
MENSVGVRKREIGLSDYLDKYLAKFIFLLNLPCILGLQVLRRAYSLA